MRVTAVPVSLMEPGPYAPASAIIEVITRYRAGRMPGVVTAETLSRGIVSDSLIPRTLQALRILDLIDEAGKPTQTLEHLRLSPEAEFKQRVLEWLQTTYQEVVIYFDIEKATEQDIRDAFRPFKPNGQQDRMASLFSGLFSFAGVGVERTARLKSTSKVRATVRKPKQNDLAPCEEPNALVTYDASPAEVRPAGLLPDWVIAARAKEAAVKSVSETLLAHFDPKEMDEAQQDAVWTLLKYFRGKGL